VFASYAYCAFANDSLGFICCFKKLRYLNYWSKNELDQREAGSPKNVV
jgi:hypothetical protein